MSSDRYQLRFLVSASVLRLWIDFGSDSWALDMFRLWSWADRFWFRYMGFSFGMIGFSFGIWAFDRYRLRYPWDFRSVFHIKLLLNRLCFLPNSRFFNVDGEI
ncbi:unnamed protein product [Rhizophagus irregularis]|nr:unnamed protein product [Rhizophagus irregularis]